jgi:hypothetical protein
MDGERIERLSLDDLQVIEFGCTDREVGKVLARADLGGYDPFHDGRAVHFTGVGDESLRGAPGLGEGRDLAAGLAWKSSTSGLTWTRRTAGP